MANEKVEQTEVKQSRLYKISATHPKRQDKEVEFIFAENDYEAFNRSRFKRNIDRRIEMESCDLTVSIPDSAPYVSIFQTEKDARWYAYEYGNVLYDGKALKEEQEEFSDLKATLLKTFDETQKIHQNQ
ncbi:hypothetical protein [Legionella tunisiensis]|uniref:hypothetical protein n=1 Tax=Legionella tunisiensis TaxID=1034944 RepID=UPI00036D3EAD|nr:hypothetical protein [Legionella tunisiensis]